MIFKRIRNVNHLMRCYKHRNHPGHKLPPPAYKPCYELPDHYLEEPNYPPIKPCLPPGDWPQGYEKNLAWKYWEEGEKFTSLKTIQERLSVLAYLNVQQTLDDLRQRRTRHYPIFMLSSIPKTPRMSPFVNFITKTSIKIVKSLPSTTPLLSYNPPGQYARFYRRHKIRNGNYGIDKYKGEKIMGRLTSVDEASINFNESDENLNKVSCQNAELNKAIDFDTYEKLKHKTKEIILMNFNQSEELPEKHSGPENAESYNPDIYQMEKRHNHIEKSSNQLIQKLFLMLTTVLRSQNENRYLDEAQYCENVDIRAYWKRCGFKNVTPRGAIAPDVDVIRFQFEDKAAFQIKCDMPLKPIFDLKDVENLDICVPNYAYSPSVFKIFANHILPMQTPGHWFGDTREFNYLSIFNTSKTIHFLQNRLSNYDDHLESLKSMSTMCAHAELTAQAYYLGFSMWKDLTYPLLGQFLFSNGQDYALMNYQLNTLRLWNNGTKLSNLAYLTIPERLFEINSDRSQVTSFNDALFKKILNILTERKPIQDPVELVPSYSEIDHMIGGTRLRPYLSIQNLNTQLTKRHQLLATSLYELVKYDRPMDYLLYRSQFESAGKKPKFHLLYDKFTYQYRDIVIDFYPRDYYGFKLIERLTRKAPRQTYKFWDLKSPVYEWANIPPPDTNNIPRNIELPTF